MKMIPHLLVMALCVLGFTNKLYASSPSPTTLPMLTEITALKPNPENGKDVYLTCALCHSPQGWGTADGYYPQISGQLPNVLLKQLIDIKLGNRDVPTMIPFSNALFEQDRQNIADLVAYISALPMNPENSRGDGSDLASGEKLYADYCQSCHGKNGEGENAKNYPLLQGQHYHYLLRQMKWIKNGKRKNGDEKMRKDISGFTDKQLQAVADYISRIKPDANKVANSTSWRNPDFNVNFVSTPWQLRSTNKKSADQ